MLISTLWLENHVNSIFSISIAYNIKFEAPQLKPTNRVNK